MDHRLTRFFIADFYCASSKLILEVDGPIHILQNEQDSIREANLVENGFQVLRLTNREVLEDWPLCVRKLEEVLRTHPQPPL